MFSQMFLAHILHFCFYVTVRENKNGVLWSQARMRIEMLIGHFVIDNLQLTIEIGN